MNFLTGLIIVICLYAGAQAFYTTEIVELNPDFPQQGEDGLMPGDTIYAINGERIYLKSDVSLIMGLGDTGTIDMTVLRDGKKFDARSPGKSTPTKTVRSTSYALPYAGSSRRRRFCACNTAGTRRWTMSAS